MQRRFHYEQAFEHCLRANRVPYVAVDEARRTLLPPEDHATATVLRLKSFDFVLYHDSGNLVVDVKGRMYTPPSAPGNGKRTQGHSKRRFESWVTREDVESLTRWQSMFGEGFTAVFVFIYCLCRQPPDALFEEVFEFKDRWYALRVVDLDDYCKVMTPRSSSWQTVHVAKDQFARISRPFRLKNGSRTGIPGAGVIPGDIPGDIPGVAGVGAASYS